VFKVSYQSNNVQRGTDMSIDNHNQVTILRQHEVLRRMGYRKSTLYNRIKERCFPPPVSLGGKSVGWVDYEIEQTLTSLLAGQSKKELQTLVADMLAYRQTKFSNSVTHQLGGI
jgi:prophage regulatory protein